MQESQEYELLDIPGLDNLKIAITPKMRRNESDDSGVRTREWTLTMDTVFLPTTFIELFGWYAESERETGTDVGNQLFTSSSIKHSELVVVIPCGKHLADLENMLASGELISNVIITRFIRIGIFIELPIQINTFRGCYITMVQQYLDYLIVRLRISKKTVVCTAFDQDGFPSGVGLFNVSFISGATGFGLADMLEMLW
ncbi:MAG: hypothetical protein LBJ89_03290 [Holosporales bacterium]|jgi:hypothetical protein|nr:hypothetical protein [Holosporales bacterium]